MSTLVLDLPANVEPAEARQLLALALVRADRISVGKGAEVAGLSYRAFWDYCMLHGVAPVAYDIDDLAADLETLATQRSA